MAGNSAKLRGQIGVLALQGDFAAHIQILQKLGASTVEVRRPRQLNDIVALVIPGGESTALIKLLNFEPEWWQALPNFVNSGNWVFGTCAGLILLANEVTEPSQKCFSLLDVRVERNAYGRQVDSFIADGHWETGQKLPMVFIRAPKIITQSPDVKVLASFEEDATLVQQGRVIAGSFHPEINGELSVHQFLLEQIAHGSESVQ